MVGYVKKLLETLLKLRLVSKLAPEIVKYIIWTKLRCIKSIRCCASEISPIDPHGGIRQLVLILLNIEGMEPSNYGYFSIARKWREEDEHIFPSGNLSG